VKQLGLGSVPPCQVSGARARIAIALGPYTSRAPQQRTPQRHLVNVTFNGETMSSNASVAAPAVVDKHAELLKMVNKCTHYKCTLAQSTQARQQKKKIFLTFCLSSSSHTVVRTFCMHCYMALIDASPNTVDCRLGVLCGCGARYCGVKCLVAASQAHKVVCENIQKVLQFFAKSRFRANEKTNQAGLEWGGHVQIELLRADIVVAASDVVDSLVDVSKILRIAEAFELAQKFAQRALSLAAKGSLDEARALNLLGVVEKNLSKYDAAVAHYEAALSIRKSLLGDKHTDVADVCMNLSVVFPLLRRLDEALAMCSSALEIYSKAPGDNQKNLASCHNNMGLVLRQQDKHDEAMEHYSTGLELALRTEGETTDAAAFLLNIGVVLVDQNKFDDAMEKLTSALRLFEKAKVGTSIAMCHYNIGNLLMEQGKLDEALEHARKALAIRRSKLSIEHADCGESHYLIGDNLVRSGKFAEALDEFENALRIRKNVYGEMTLQVADVYENKACCFFNLRKWREAVTFYEATIHIRTVLVAADDTWLVKVKALLAEAEEQLKAERSSAASERK
jgi:tetratricopeptide (TPR) repeat protein